MGEHGAEAEVAEGFGLCVINVEKLRSIGFRMDGLVPVKGALGGGFDLGRLSEEVGR
jgi:hypothetical protein